MKATLQILREARALIDDPASWTTGEYARDVTGRSVEPDSNDACKFCAIGAISRAAHLSPKRAEQELEYVLVRQMLEDNWVINFNDRGSHADVLELFDRAIAAEEAALAKVMP